jgi:uncharacterized protein YwqG
VPDLLPAFRIITEPLPQDLLDRKALGQRSKFGGKPTWEQGDETPTCPECGKTMVFVAQLDSIGFDQKNAEGYIFGDVGLIYVFFSFDDGNTRSIFQCT